MGLFKQNEYFYGVNFFLIELSFLKGDANIYFEYISLFKKKKKIFTEKNTFFVKIKHIFFLKIYIFFSNSFPTFEEPFSATREATRIPKFALLDIKFRFICGESDLF